MSNWLTPTVELPLITGLLTLHCIMGWLAMLVATRKGYRRNRWIWLGLIGGTPALIAAILRPSLNSDT